MKLPWNSRILPWLGGKFYNSWFLLESPFYPSKVSWLPLRFFRKKIEWQANPFLFFIYFHENLFVYTWQFSSALSIFKPNDISKEMAFSKGYLFFGLTCTLQYYDDIITGRNFFYSHETSFSPWLREPAMLDLSSEIKSVLRSVAQQPCSAHSTAQSIEMLRTIL